jgi:hypothetical protein
MLKIYVLSTKNCLNFGKTRMGGEEGGEKLTSFLANTVRKKRDGSVEANGCRD